MYPNQGQNQKLAGTFTLFTTILIPKLHINIFYDLKLQKIN